MQAFVYQDQLNPVAEYDGSGTLVARFIYGSRPNVPDFTVKGAATYRVLSDHLGSPRLVVETSTNTVSQRIDYDEFGQIIQDTSPGFQPFGFAGGIHEPISGVTRFGARDYDAEVGRWNTKEPLGFLGDGSNLFLYTLNEPVGLVDPSGLVSLQQVSNAAAGFGNVVSFGASGLLERAVGNALFGGNEELAFEPSSVVDQCSTAFGVGTAAGYAHALGTGGAGLLKAAGYQTKVAIHGAHHTFGGLGKLAHVQLVIWKQGVKGSGRSIRVPLPSRAGGRPR